MNFGAELLTLRSLSLQPQDSFELFITIDGKPIPETFGKDDYLLSLSLAEGRRICATGRKCMHRRPNNGEKFLKQDLRNRPVCQKSSIPERCSYLLKTLLSRKQAFFGSPSSCAFILMEI